MWTTCADARVRRRGSPLRVHALPRDPAGTLKPAMLPEAVTGRGVRVSGRSRVRHAARTPGGGSLHSPAASASRILSTAGGQSRNSARARPSLCSRKPLQCQPRGAEKRTQATRKRHASAGTGRGCATLDKCLELSLSALRLQAAQVSKVRWQLRGESWRAAAQRRRPLRDIRARSPTAAARAPAPLAPPACPPVRASCVSGAPLLRAAPRGAF